MGVDDHDTFTGLTQLQAAAAEGNVARVIELLDQGADANIQANGEVRRVVNPSQFPTSKTPTRDGTETRCLGVRLASRASRTRRFRASGRRHFYPAASLRPVTERRFACTRIPRRDGAARDPPPVAHRRTITLTIHASSLPQMAGKTAAMIAASNGSTEILKAINRGPSLLNLQDADGGTAAMSAAVHAHTSVLDYVRHPQPPQSRSRPHPPAPNPRPAPLATPPRPPCHDRPDPSQSRSSSAWCFSSGASKCGGRLLKTGG